MPVKVNIGPPQQSGRGCWCGCGCWRRRRRGRGCNVWGCSRCRPSPSLDNGDRRRYSLRWSREVEPHDGAMVLEVEVQEHDVEVVDAVVGWPLSGRGQL